MATPIHLPFSSQKGTTQLLPVDGKNAFVIGSFSKSASFRWPGMCTKPVKNTMPQMKPKSHMSLRSQNGTGDAWPARSTR